MCKMKKMILLFLIFSMVYSVSSEEYKLPDGSVYIGEMKNGLFDGQGQQIFQNDAKFTGEFSNGLYNGYGTYESHLYI